MMMVRQIALLLVSVSLLLPNTVMAGPGAFFGVEKGQECGENEDFKVCRNRTEGNAIKAFPGKVSRSGLNLSLKLNNGKAKVYKDEAANLDGALCGYRFVTYVPEADFYLVDQMCERDHTYRFVSAMDGKTKATGTEYPKASFAGDKILMMDADRQLNFPLFQVFISPKKGAMTFEAKYELKALDGIYWPSNLFSQWKDANNVLIADARGQEFNKNLLGMSRYDGQKWAMRLDGDAIQKRKQALGGGSQAATPSPSLAGEYFINDGHMEGAMEVKSLGGNKYFIHVNAVGPAPGYNVCNFEGKGEYQQTGALVVQSEDGPEPVVMRVSGKDIIIDSPYSHWCGSNAYLNGKYARK